MRIKKIIIVCLVLLATNAGFALKAEQILIIANSDVKESVLLAEYYCQKRQVPKANILALHLGASLGDTISRADYNKKLVRPIRKELLAGKLAGKIRCLLTTYGVPVKVGQRDKLKGQEEKLKKLMNSVAAEKDKLRRFELSKPADLQKQKRIIGNKIERFQLSIDYITGRETNASVDSELSLVLFDEYELYRWRPNKLKFKFGFWDFKSLMVCRLDGPGLQIAKGLIDKSISAEKNGLKGKAYIDSRGIKYDKNPGSFGYFDESLRDLAEIIDIKGQLPLVEERTAALFAPGQCPSVALYCGWYSLKKYVDAFEFNDGAIGYHIASWEAIDLRDPNSSQWCPAMLVDGVTATLGAVAEPYLNAFPEPKEFFAELFEGFCLVEAYYRTKPLNSWQLILIGDPLYRPFREDSVLGVSGTVSK